MKLSLYTCDFSNMARALIADISNAKGSRSQKFCINGQEAKASQSDFPVQRQVAKFTSFYVAVDGFLQFQAFSSCFDEANLRLVVRVEEDGIETVIAPASNAFEAMYNCSSQQMTTVIGLSDADTAYLFCNQAIRSKLGIPNGYDAQKAWLKAAASEAYGFIRSAKTVGNRPVGLLRQDQPTAAEIIRICRNHTRLGQFLDAVGAN